MKLEHEPTSAPKGFDKSETNEKLELILNELSELQNVLYAEKKHSLLIILQGMDTSGKDGTIRHVFSYVNPQGCNVRSFKTPTEEERLHDFLWRINPHAPSKGMIQVFNRSHYEDVIFPVVHKLLNKKQIAERYMAINNFEKHLQNNNTIIIKFYLNISKKEQSARLNERLNDPKKKWKYNADDKIEARKWGEYMAVYQDVFKNTSGLSPWIIVPADDKWYRNYFVANKIVKTLEKLNMEYPKSINAKDKKKG